MSDISEDINTLKLWRDNNERKSREILQKWNDTLSNNTEKLGAEGNVILEQVCLAALDCFQIDVAQKCVRILYKQFPESLRVKKLEAMCYEANENYEGAVKILDDIISSDPTNSLARKRKVALLKAQGKPSEAVKELVDYLKIYMADAEAWQELSELYISENDFNKACFCIEELLLHNPHNHLLHQRLADVRYTQGGFDNMELAKSYYCHALKLNSKNLRALYGLYLVSSSLAISSRSSAQKKKENSQLAQKVLVEIRKLYVDAELDSIEDKLTAIQL